MIFFGMLPRIGLICDVSLRNDLKVDNNTFISIAVKFIHSH